LTAEIAEIKAITHTWQLDGKALYWHTADAVFGSWYDNVNRRIFEHHLDTNPPQAARIYALMSVAHYDAYIACWDAKYAYWSMRPYEVDPTVETLLPPPPHPSYPSGHGCTMGAMAAILAHLFPEQAAYINALADEAGESRIWAGIHYRQDIEVGLALGKDVAQKVIEHDQ
jgi:membrane-associated phospholipid phosphatase